ncbi:MAG: phosphatase PAP2 family protein [Pseudomonadota bacterium]
MPTTPRLSPMPLLGVFLMVAGLGLWQIAPTLDLRLLMAFRLAPSDPAVPAVQILTIFGGLALLAPFTLIVAGGLAFWGDRRRALWLVFTVASGRIAVEIAKLVFARERPPLAGRLDVVSSYSFPSAHSAGTTILWLSLAVLFAARSPWLLPIALGVATVMGWSRMALGVHWPGDVLSGFGLALFWVGIARCWLPPAPRRITAAG